MEWFALDFDDTDDYLPGSDRATRSEHSKGLPEPNGKTSDLTGQGERYGRHPEFDDTAMRNIVARPGILKPR
ncbi:hypothetical protein ZHAS_00021856 [Anopheles sinensis]|uniref:Uncharacterized protein n=1 Tax=Anopheles sinensis TaxID=74873 RepID=A0A084WTS2_ANOSI|nr:hypothetical protein ZHAS_00021856 [Anopheles sinensis]